MALIKASHLARIRRARIGKDEVWMTRFARPLQQVVPDQLVMDVGGDLDNCESGFCMT